MNDLITTEPQVDLLKPTKYQKQMDSAKKAFCLAIASGKNRREAMSIAFPDLMARSSNAYMRLKAYRLLTNDDVLTEVQVQQQRLEQLGGKAINTLEDIMDVGLEHNALQASQFVYEQIHGKARQRVEIEGKFVTVTYDLSGGKAGAVPQEIIDQLNADD
jgi:hypothetical protein